MRDHGGREISRRAALRALGLGAFAGAVVGGGMLSGCSTGSSGAAGGTPITVRDWVANRGSQYYIAHRGSGDVIPEHSMVAYQAAMDWGAQCMEISVGVTADGVLICMHDATYDRTTTLTGPVDAQPWSVVRDARILQPRLGEFWVANAPRIPLLEDVLRTFGGRMVLAVEAKDHQAYEPIMAMIDEHGLGSSVIVKAHYTSDNWREAKSSDFPVFCYFGATTETTVQDVAAIGAELDPDLDCLVIPGFAADGTFVTDDVVAAAVGTGVPVWVHPLHRRSDVSHFFDLGAQGAICSSFGYVTDAVAPSMAPSWADQEIASGEMTRDPSLDSYAPSFTTAGELILGAKGAQHFITLGQLGPQSAASPLRIEVESSWIELPASLSNNLTIAFGRADDSYYEHRLGQGNGFHAILRADGELGLYRHVDGEPSGTPLAPPIATPALVAGQPVRLRIEAVDNQLSLSRLDAAAVVSAEAQGSHQGYIHLGRSSPDGVAAFRGLTLTS